VRGLKTARPHALLLSVNNPPHNSNRNSGVALWSLEKAITRLRSSPVSWDYVRSSPNETLAGGGGGSDVFMNEQ
jgi:hypothetical protein